MLGLHGSLEHILVHSFGKYDTLWVLCCGGVQVACEFRFLSEQLHKLVFVCLEVLYLSSCHAAVNSRFCHCCADNSYQSWVYGLRNEVFLPEGKVVHVVNLVYNVGHGLLCQFGYGVHGCEFHFLVDGFCVYVERATEDVGEAYDVVNLVRIVRATSSHKHVGACCHCVFVRYFGYWICQCEHDRVVVHRLNHLFRENVAL